MHSVNDLINLKLVHSLHTSEAMSFRGCRRRWDWIFRGGYYPTVTPKPLEFGQAFHTAMEKYYDPHTWHDKETAAAIAQASFVQACKDHYKQYLKLNQGNVNPDAKADYEDRIKLGQGMIRYYTKYVSPLYDQDFEPVKTEIEFEVPITGPNGEYMWCKCDRCLHRWNEHWHSQDEGRTISTGGRLVDAEDPIEVRQWPGLPVTYGGRIDMIIRDSLGRLWVWDHKTSAQLAGTPTGSGPWAEDDFMLLDTQITRYCWALWVIGIPVVGFIYAQYKKAVPEEPEPNKVQRLGRWYSVNKQISTTYDMYYQTVAENDPQALASGVYDDFLNYLKSPDGPRFHLRHQVFRSETELRSAGEHIWQEAKEMTDPNLSIYPSPGRFTCGNCAYQDPCIAKNRGDDYQYALDTLYEKRPRHYWERPPSTDSKAGQ